MFKSEFATYPTTTEASYGQNVARAARAFLAALLAVQPAQAKAARPAADQRTNPSDISELYRLAASFDSVSPNLANELRFIAGRT